MTSTLVYGFACDGPLPCVDSHKSLVRVLFHRSRLPLGCIKRLLPVFYALGLICSAVMPIVSRDYGVWLALITPVLCLPSVLVSTLALRADIALLILQTFEFWYVTSLNIVATILMCIMLGDIRALVPLTSCIGFEVPFLIDAIHRAPHAAITVSVFGAGVLLYLIVVVSFRLVHDTHVTVVFRNARRELLAEEVVANVLATVVVLLLRNAYRKYHLVRQTSRIASGPVIVMGSCIMYRCRLHLRDVHTVVLEATACHDDSTTTQLVFAASTKTFDGQHTMMRCTTTLTPWSRMHQLSLWLIGFSGLLVTVVSSVTRSLLGPYGSLVACVTTSVFTSVSAAHYHPRLLLRELGSSFDFLFLTTQSLLAHGCLCDLLCWDVRCLGVVSSALWMQWFLSLDALTPVMKHKLGVVPSAAFAIGVVILCQQLALVVELVLFPSNDFRERILFTIHLANRVLHVRVVPILLSRIATLVVWLGRLAWRVLHASPSELVVLQGQVKYHDRVFRRPRHGIVPTVT